MEFQNVSEISVYQIVYANNLPNKKIKILEIYTIKNQSQIFAIKKSKLKPILPSSSPPNFGDFSKE